MELILASNSPRRKEILTNANVKFKVIKPVNEEIPPAINNVYLYAEILAKQKAIEVFNKTPTIVLGADTVVCFNGKIIGKPKDKTDAINTLKMLSNNTHEVITGYAIITNNGQYIGHDITEVTFNELSDNLINSYVESGSPLDKAGSYGIQDGYNLVKEIKGSYYNVMGLPIEKILKVLNNLQ